MPTPPSPHTITTTLHEECGVFGIHAPYKYDIAHSIYYGLFALQHRGQESCGIVVNDDGLFTSYKDSGLVEQVFSPAELESLGEGSIAVGHVRYGTAKKGDRFNAQPHCLTHIKGRLALAMNGSLVNYQELREELELQGAVFHTTGDAELISYIIIKERLKADSIEEAISRTMTRLKGAYSLVIMSPSKLIAVRDPFGFHPLCYGKTTDGREVIASESCALDSVGAELIRDIEPGEIAIFDKDGLRSRREHCDTVPMHSCVFEFIYFARPDSIIDGASVHEARLRAGAFLALEHPVQADVVIGVPDSGIDAAIGYAHQSGLPYGLGFIKNKYIGRTFIAPGQLNREDKVKIKLNPIAKTVRGKRVVLIDDSIVRGTTSAQIVKLLREAGATEVHLRVSAPPFINICYYGTDIESKDALIACNHTMEEMQQIIGVDSLGFLNYADVKKIACGAGCKGFCTACFDGEYCTEIPKASMSKYDNKITNLGRAADE